MGLPDKEQLQLENWNLSGFSFFSRSRSDDGGRDRRKKRSRSRSRDRHHRRVLHRRGEVRGQRDLRRRHADGTYSDSESLPSDHEKFKDK